MYILFFFNIKKQVPTVPLKTPIDSIKFDPTCQHRKKLTTNQAGNNNIQAGKLKKKKNTYHVLLNQVYFCRHCIFLQNNFFKEHFYKKK